MKDILNDTYYAEIRNRIQALSESNTRRWGKMDLEQMLVHCTMQLKLAIGEIASQPQGPSFMRSSLGKWMLFSMVPWPKGSNTPAEMNADLADFTLTDIGTEKQDLLMRKKSVNLKPTIRSLLNKKHHI